ncbi:MAG: helix-turn-helix domain-containing protein, partial [Planctomycetota bacterium]|nr:helix-turn-helix domain-containing protein [Planctomycetota bacterium]
ALTLPPLRDRREDIHALWEHFVSLHCENKEKLPQIDRGALRLLLNYDWPGNIRELENEVKRCLALCGSTISSELLSDSIRSQHTNPFSTDEISQLGIKEIVRISADKLEREIILSTLQESGWKKSECARILQISRPTLDAKIAHLQIEIPRRIRT